MAALQCAVFFATMSSFEALRSYNTTSKRMNGKINVHMVPHTHDDVGWLKTVDQYYYGSHNEIARATVQNILNSVMKELAWNPDRKFIYVEQAFFQRWWSDVDDKMRNLTSGLVASGQLEFVNGGWCMHDEANPSFVDMIDQTSLGHRFLRDEFNITPRVQWQIDPFGHSTFQASMMSSPLAGYNGVYFMRADWQDIAARQAARTTEMIWAPSSTHGMRGATFAGILYGGYCTIPGISMSEWGFDEPVMDNLELEEFNVEEVVATVLASVYDDVSKYPQGGASDGTADVMFPLGCDFEYENAATWFTNTDKVIHYLNLDGRVNAFYSTPSAYTDAKLQAGRSYTLKTDDFFPYDFFPHGYLTGFYTSRPALKGYIRESSSLMQAAKQAQLFTGGAANTGPGNPLFRLERALGVNQHHDAISGTAKQNVTYDYARRLAWGRQDIEVLFNNAYATLTGYTGAPFVGCDLANATICPALENGQASVVLVWNQQAQRKAFINVMLPVGLPEGVSSYTVLDASGTPVVAQLLPLSQEDAFLRTGYYGYTASTTAVQWLAWRAAGVPPAGYSVFFLVPTAGSEASPTTHTSRVARIALHWDREASSPPFISNGVQTLTFNLSSGLLQSYANSATNLSMPMTQNLLWYNSSVGSPTGQHPCAGEHCEQNSGAYIFRPNGLMEMDPAMRPGGGATLTLVTGPVVNEGRAEFNAWASQVTRLWAGEDSGFDQQWTVGPIPINDRRGKEVISLFSTPLASNGTWWTDSNGRDSNKRMRDHRPTWNLTVEEPVAGNYYPVPAFIHTQDVVSGVTLSVVPDRAQGGSSITDGSLELMIHRRLTADDFLGVTEVLNETGLNINGEGLAVRGLHRVMLQPDAVSGAIARREAVADALFKPVLRFAALRPDMTPAQWLAQYRGNYSGLAAPLPPNVHLLTTHSLGPSTLLLRVSHSYEASEGGAMSRPVTLALANIFARPLTLQSCTEQTLSGNQPLASARSYTYNVTGGPSSTLPFVPDAPSGPDMEVTLQPLDIRTFACTVAVAKI